MSACEGCALNYFDSIARFYKNNENSIEFLRKHGVLPTIVKCPKCGKDCSFRKDQQIWRCRQSSSVPKTRKRRYCDFSVSDYKDTVFHNVNLPPWKVILFVNHWLSKHWDHGTVIKCLKISHTTSVDWRSFCSKVTDFWFENQDSIGGPGLVVEVDKTLIVHGKQEKGSASSQVWLFGGVERGTKKRFLVPLQGPEGEWQDQGTLLPLIKRFIRSGSVIVSDHWGAYNGLKDYGYTHHVIKQSEHTVDPEDSEIHTQNIKRLWRDLKEWVKRPGIRSNFLYQYLARYLFITTHEDKDYLLHEFFMRVAQLFPPPSNQHCQPPPSPVTKETVEGAAQQE